MINSKIADSSLSLYLIENVGLQDSAIEFPEEKVLVCAPKKVNRRQGASRKRVKYESSSCVGTVLIHSGPQTASSTWLLFALRLRGDVSAEEAVRWDRGNGPYLDVRPFSIDPVRPI